MLVQSVNSTDTTMRGDLCYFVMYFFTHQLLTRNTLNCMFLYVSFACNVSLSERRLPCAVSSLHCCQLTAHLHKDPEQLLYWRWFQYANKTIPAISIVGPPTSWSSQIYFTEQSERRTNPHNSRMRNFG